MRAALPQISERKGHIVVVSSVAAFANGMMGSSYMTSKAGVEQMGRALRTELMPLGAGASVAYFGWVDTRMVQDTFARPGASVLEEIAPDFLMKRITPEQAGAAVVRGSKSGRRGSSLRSGGATSPLCAACSTHCSTVAASGTRVSSRRSARPRHAARATRRPRPRRARRRAMPAYDLNGKVALVTGGARGIGYETARQLHQRGASVALVDIDAAETREAAERIGERAIGIAADVTDAGALRAAVAETVERFGGLDIAMANAGIAPRPRPRSAWSPPRSGSA